MFWFFGLNLDHVLLDAKVVATEVKKEEEMKRKGGG